MPVSSKCFVFFLKIKIVAAESIMPEQSKKIVKLNILSNSFAQKIMMIQMAANTESETVSTSVLLLRFLKTGGRILSSLIAYITLGLLINKTFTYASTLKNKKPDKTLSAFTPKIFDAIIAA